MHSESNQGRREALGRVTRELEAIRRQFREDDRKSAMLAAPINGAAVAVVGDWGSLLGAVKDRLRLIVGEPLVTGNGLLIQAELAQIRASVVECADALEQLHEAVRQGAVPGLRLEIDSVATPADGPSRGEVMPAQRHRAQGPVDRQSPPLALMVLDFDGLRSLHDAHGAAARDELIRIVAARLFQTVRVGDRVTHLGRDAFACLLPDPLDRGQLDRLAGRVFDAVSAPMTIGTLETCVCPSIGIAVGPGDGSTAAALLESASAAMARARQAQTRYAFCS